MKALKLSLLAATAALAISGAAQAQERPLGLTFNVGVASDYVFRGVSQTDEKPQGFVGADASLGSIGYAGVWASNVDFGDSTDMEVDLYAGIRPTAGPVTLDLGVIHYVYHNEPEGSDWTYTEFKVAGSVPVGPATVGAAAYLTDDFTGGLGGAAYYEVNGALPIAGTPFSVSGALGKQTLQDVEDGDWSTWNVGVGYAITDKIGLDVRAWGTDADNLGSIYEDRVVASLKVTF